MVGRLTGSEGAMDRVNVPSIPTTWKIVFSKLKMTAAENNDETKSFYNGWVLVPTYAGEMRC